MKSFIPTISVRYLVLPLVVVTALSGCAVLNLKALGFGDDKEDDQEFAGDPVAAAAARFRGPASSASDKIELQEGAHSNGKVAPREHILMGMRMSDVESVWGQPSSIETAGNSGDGNQRWTYFAGLSSRWGMGSRRVVYFENGRVAGWKQ